MILGLNLCEGYCKNNNIMWSYIILKSEQIERACFLIKMGTLIDVDDASSSRDSLCIGDFRDIGWSTRVATRDSLCYEWNGPRPN